MSEETPKKSIDWKSLLNKAWDKVSLAILKAFRGLVCEKKDNGWELSKGNLAFWIVLVHCMMVWNGDHGKVENLMKSAASVATAVATEAIESVSAETVTATDEALTTAVESLIGGPVPDQEFWFLVMLLGYATTKRLANSSVDLMSAFRDK